MKNEMTNLINAQTVALLNTVDESGFPSARAMSILSRNGIKEFYFTTNATSLKVEQIKKSGKTSLYFYDADTFRSVNLIGHTYITDNETEFENEPNFEVLNEDNYLILHFIANKCRYFNGSKTYTFLL